MFLRPITEADLEFCRNLRNANREWFISSGEITQAGQRAWWDRISEDPEYEFYIIVNEPRERHLLATPIGTISLSKHGPGWEVGNLALAEPYRGGGMATRAIELLTQIANQRFWAHIKPHNTASQNAFRAAGWQQITEDEWTYQTMSEPSQPTTIAKLLSAFRGPAKRVLVIGDIILDVYQIGTATRISPEAPVPIILNPKEETRLGGAGAVAAMCRRLGAVVTLVGDIGKDERLRELLTQADIRIRCTMDRPTTTKTRLCGLSSGRHRQQIARIDVENTSQFPNATLNALASNVVKTLGGDEFDIILIADYGKGVCNKWVLTAISSTRRLRTIVDPTARDWDKYRGVACITPNRLEAEDRPETYALDNCDIECTVFKLDRDGCRVVYRDPDKPELIHTEDHPTRAVTIHDVTSAGDQFLATLGLGRAYGADWGLAADLANVAAGLQVERYGSTPVTWDELNERVKRL